MTASDQAIKALVLAGARASGDPLCDSEGVDSKAVIDISGAPMLSHVMSALAQAGVERPIWLLGGREDGLRMATGGIDFTMVAASGAGPASSLAAALKGPVETPLLVTTADHPLLTSEMIAHFLSGARDNGADISVGFARRSTIEAAFPETRRTYLPLGEKDLSGCNLFYLANPQALSVLEFWGSVERHRKHPWRIARRMGLRFLLRLLRHRSSTDKVFDLLSERLGARIRPVILPFAEAAVDVDTRADLDMVRDILERRRLAETPPS